MLLVPQTLKIATIVTGSPETCQCSRSQEILRFAQDDVIASGAGRPWPPWGVIRAQCVGVPSLATLPHLGLAVKVQYGKNPDFFCYCKEVHPVWEAMQESAVNFIFQSRNCSGFSAIRWNTKSSSSRKRTPRPDCWSSYHTAAAWMSSSDCGRTTMRHAISQINDHAAFA